MNLEALVEALQLDPDETDVEKVRARIRALFADARCVACDSYRVGVISRPGHAGIVVQCRACSHLSIMLAGWDGAAVAKARDAERTLVMWRAGRRRAVPSWRDWHPRLNPPWPAWWPETLRGAA